MSCSRRFLPALLAVLVLAAPVLADKPGSPSPRSKETSAAPAGGALSTRVVAYKIDARLDTAKKTLDATELLTYRNLTGRPLDEFPFHLYLNAFQPKSTFVREILRDNPNYKWDAKNAASVEIKNFEVVGVGDLTAQLKFVQPDDGNPDDRTVVQVKLPKPVPPGGEVQFRITFHDQFGEVLARNGYKDDFFMGAQWFPKVGVFWNGAWNCHQFHRNTEFFADFGTYDVNLTLPQNFVVGSSGNLVATHDNGNGTKTVTWHGDDIIEFAWTADPHFRLFEDTFQGSAGSVKIYALIQDTHLDQAQRYIAALKGTLDRFDRWVGPYPYDRITLVDPRSLQAGGMEYPALFTGDTYFLMPKGLLFPEMVTEHEFGHQYWMALVATNEFEDAWLDEGLNTYTEIKILDSLYGKENSFATLLGGHIGDRRQHWASYTTAADTDPLVRPAWQFMNGNAYGSITYSKTGMMLLTLEGVIGEDTLRNAIRTYYMRYRFTHPTKEDFLKTIQEVSGRDLKWYFDQAVYGTQVLDYEVGKVQSVRHDWYETNPPAGKPGETVYDSTVLVHRKGDFIFPVTVQVNFDNGEAVREQWDGRDRWTRFNYSKKAKVVSAEVDPDHIVWLDHDLFNNSLRAQPVPAARHKLTGYVVVCWQFIAEALAWLA